MKTLNEALEAYIKLQKEMSALQKHTIELSKAHNELLKESIKDKKEIMKFRGIVYSSPSLN